MASVTRSARAATAALVATFVVFLVAGALTAVPARAQTGAPRAGVLCVLSGQSEFPFGAGNDRCFKEINGKTLAPASVTACFVQGSDYTRVTFVFSALASTKCDEFSGKTATKAQYEPALSALGAKEKAFFLEHIGAGR